MDFNETNNVTLIGIGRQPARWGWWTQQTLTPIVVLVGIGGNFISFLLMNSNALRKKSYSHILSALAIFDSLCLINREITLIHEALVDSRKDGVFTNYNDVSCSIYSFYDHVCYLMSSWLVVGMAAERVMTMCFPFRRTLLKTRTRAMGIITIMFLFICISQLFRLIMVKNINGFCLGDSYLFPSYIYLHIYFYQLILVLTLPFAVIFMCNCLVIYQIYRVRKAARNIRSRAINRSHKTTIMLLTISFTYLVTMLPLVVISFVWLVAMEYGYSEWVFHLYPIQQSISVISHCNYGVNFFIYILSGRTLRFELRRIFSRERLRSLTKTRTREEILRLA